MDRKSKIVVNEMKRLLGYPMLPIEISESQIKEFALTPGLLDYYRQAPYEVYYSYKFTFANATRTVQIEPILQTLRDKITATPHDCKSDDVYFLGISRIDEDTLATTIHDPLLYWQQSNVGNRIGEALTGGDLWLDLVHANTLNDLFIGDAHYEYDPIDNTMTFTYPSEGSLQVWWAFGFDTVKFVPQQHLLILAHIAAIRLLESVQAARTAIRAGEIEMPVDTVSSRLDELKTQLPNVLMEIQKPVILWG
jgi:hypothetical protein